MTGPSTYPGHTICSLSLDNRAEADTRSQSGGGGPIKAKNVAIVFANDRAFHREITHYVDVLNLHPADPS